MFLQLLRHPEKAFSGSWSLGICFSCPKHLVYMLTFTPGGKWQEENIVIFGALLGYLYRSHALYELLYPLLKKVDIAGSWEGWSDTLSKGKSVCGNKNVKVGFQLLPSVQKGGEGWSGKGEAVAVE